MIMNYGLRIMDDEQLRVMSDELRVEFRTGL